MTGSGHAVNLYSMECIKAVSKVGSTTYHNLCSGTSTVIQWGSVDYMIFGAFIVLMLFVVGTLYRMFCVLWKTVI